MNALIDPVLLQKLSRSRLAVRHAVARGGVGERPAGTAPSGIEFADHRPYEPGDDLRHVDPHVYGRTGQHVVRRYLASAALDVTVLVDASASMGFGRGASTKLQHATRVAAGMVAAGIAGGDRVVVGTFRDRAVAWHDALTGMQRYGELDRWLSACAAAGASEFATVAASCAPHLRPRGLLVAIGDWLGTGAEDAFGAWRNLGQEVVVVHVVSDADLPSEDGSRGTVRLVDAETGAHVDVLLDAATVRAQRESYEEHGHRLARAATRLGCRYFRTAVGDDLSTLFLRTWRTAGLIA